MALKKLQKLDRAFRKISPRLRLIENLRFFDSNFLSQSQKLKTYEVFLKIWGPQKSLSPFSKEIGERWPQCPIQTTGTQVALMISLGALLAETEICSQKLRHFGISFGAVLHRLKEKESMGDAEILERQLQETLQKIQADFHLPEDSTAYQLARRLGFENRII